MKKMLFIFLAAITCITIYAQDISQAEVPSVVINAFHVKFPNASDIEWERRSSGYGVDFEIGWRDHTVLIDTSGTIQRHEQDIGREDLPPAIMQVIGKTYAKYTIDDLDKIETRNEVTYEVELDGLQGDRKLVFSGAGVLKEDRAD